MDQRWIRGILNTIIESRCKTLVIWTKEQCVKKKKSGWIGGIWDDMWNVMKVEES